MPRDGHPKHGHATKRFGLSPTYISWVAMKGRCLQPKNEKYPSYGGRGVTICERWRTFANFLADMGDRPEGKTLDRFPNRNGNYEPGNCRWATPQEQADNSDIEAKGWKRNITHCPAGHPYDETSLCTADDEALKEYVVAIEAFEDTIPAARDIASLLEVPVTDIYNRRKKLARRLGKHGFTESRRRSQV